MPIESPYADRADLYAEHRWSYPPAAIDFLVDHAQLGPERDLAEIGSGTGALTERLIGCARILYAIEPDDAMRALADARLRSHPSHRSVPGTAEKTGLPDKSVDAVVVGQALHWFSADQARREFARILRIDGRVGILWTETSPSPIGKATARLFERYRRPSSGRSATTHEEIIPRYVEAGSAERGRFDWHLVQTWDRFIGGLSSSAAAPERSRRTHSRFAADAKRIFDEHATSGRVRLDLTTQAVIGRLRQN